MQKRLLRQRKQRRTKTKRPRNGTARMSQAAVRRAASPDKKTTKRPCVVAAENARFFLHDSESLSTLRDLFEAFASMSDEQFVYHAHAEKNDFASWVEYVLEDAACARSLKSATNREAAGNAVFNALRHYD